MSQALRKFDAFRPAPSVSNLSRMSTSPRFIVLWMAGAVLLAAGCSSSPASGPLGGFVAGPADDHCSMNDAMTIQTVGVCATSGGGDAAAGTGGGDASTTDYGAPIFNSDGYDDDCKYRVSVTSTPIRRNDDVTFTLAVMGLDPASPATGGMPYEEITLNETYVSPSNPNAVETPAGSGIYKISPVKFDRAGQWVVRFHLFGDCSDAPPDSPHAHVAFLINVP
jgi:hypothetical protein